ncbi:MAG: thiol:disulfide interchange protein DsbA/DsbL [Gammaproteobacteria bacterium]|nr:thiol:disulfide interchange protein DsbA/DsbL [Gammaproteobacteria bacterium]
MLRLTAKFFILLGMTFCLHAAQPLFQNGVHYVTLNLPSVNSSSSPIDVLEFFWYGCPHCYEIEKNPVFMSWLKKNSKRIHFQRVPTSLGRKEGEVHARLYYVVESLFPTSSESIHRSIFDALHSPGKGRRLLVSEPDMTSFFQEKGISPKNFKEIWDSYGIEIEVNKASVLAEKRYKITGVPTFVVGGRHMTEPSKVSDIPILVMLLDFLVEKSKGNRLGLHTSTK